MLLRDYLNSLGLVGFGGTPNSPGSLRRVGQFEVGTGYDVVLLSGVRIEFPDLTTLLEVVRAEFRACPTFDVDYGLIGSRAKGVLTITPTDALGRPWGRNIAKLIEDVTIWTTERNIYDAWPDHVPVIQQKTRGHSLWTL